MNATQAENLRILIRHMETSVTRTLCMYQTLYDCGTPACAIGEAYVCVPELRRQFEGQLYGVNYGKHADRIFGVTDRLFGSASDFTPRAERNIWGRNKVTPQEWATEARRVLAENGYSMDDTPKVDAFQRFVANLELLRYEPVIEPVVL
jgi:hypothetical protein